MIMRFILVAMMMIAIGSVSGAQEPIPVSDKTEVEFSILVDPMAVALESWSDETAPDVVLLNAYKVASGYLKGIPFQHERSRERVRITWQIEAVPDDFGYVGWESVDGAYRFDFTCMIPSDVYNDVTHGTSRQGHGWSGDENIAFARAGALDQALAEAIKSEIRQEYLNGNEPIPSVVKGRVKWFTITYEGRDYDSGDYIVDLDAWVSIDKD